MGAYYDLNAWKASMELVKEVYEIMKTFPVEERYGLQSQTKRAAISIPANIAEGVGRQYKKDTLQFLHVARGSIYEVETLLKIAVMIKILDEERFEKIKVLINNSMKILNGLINYMRKGEELR